MDGLVAKAAHIGVVEQRLDKRLVLFGSAARLPGTHKMIAGLRLPMAEDPQPALAEHAFDLRHLLGLHERGDLGGVGFAPALTPGVECGAWLRRDAAMGATGLPVDDMEERCIAGTKASAFRLRSTDSIHHMATCPE